MRGALRAIQGEMEAVIERTAMSPFIREKKDFYAALFDGAGRLIVGSNLPVFGDVVGPIAEHYPLDTMRPGDIYWFNDCYASKGAVSHSPDQVFVAPVFAEGKLAAFAQSWAHFNDIGGMRAGSLSPDCTEIYQEGIIVPPVRVAREGVIVRGAAAAVLSQLALSRDGEGRHARLHGRHPAGRAAARRAVRPLRPGANEDAFERLIAETERELRDKLRALVPEGSHAFTDTIDSDGQGHGPIKLRYRLDVTAERIVLDTSASDDQVPGPVNFLMSPAGAGHGVRLLSAGRGLRQHPQRRRRDRRSTR